MASKTRLIDTVPPSNRQKPMEVLVLGFSRTGTMSTKQALETLGYKVYHMSECCTRWEDQHIHLFEEATRAKLLGDGKLWTGAELDKVLQDYTALSDIPILHFTDELLEYYPDAKVLLTTRDFDSWKKSFDTTFFGVLNIRMLPFMVAIDSVFWRPYYFLIKSTVDKWMDGDWNNIDALRRTYTQHYEHVRSVVPEERLLNFHPSDGWAPLCKFLGKEIPKDQPFPRINEGSSTVRLHYFIIAIRLWHMSRKYIGMAAVVGIGYGLSRWWQK